MDKMKDFPRGDTVVIDVELSTQGVPDNLEGTKFFVTMKSDLSDPDSEAELQIIVDTPAGVDAQQGKVRLTLPSDKTGAEAMVPGKYHLDIQRVIPGTPPDVWTIHSQTIELLADVTKSTE